MPACGKYRKSRMIGKLITRRSHGGNARLTYCIRIDFAGRPFYRYRQPDRFSDETYEQPLSILCTGTFGRRDGLYVSFMELMPESMVLLSDLYIEWEATVYMPAAFFLGIGVIALIDKPVPEDENPHEMHMDSGGDYRIGLKRSGIMIAFAIGIHYFPEGLATFTSR